MNNYLSNMVAAQNSSSPLYMEYIMKKDKYPYFYFFEGNDDYYFYDVFVGKVDEKLAGFKKHAMGKYNLKEAAESILNYKYSNKKNVMFFFDGDYTNKIEFAKLLNAFPDNIFMLERYSIENYIVTKKTILNICKRFFRYTDGDDDYNKLVEYYDEQYHSFISTLSILNNYKYIHEKMRNEPVNLRDFDKKPKYLKQDENSKMYKFVYVSYEEYDALFDCNNCVTPNEIGAAKKFFGSDFDAKYRGHNQLHFMKCFLININIKAKSHEKFFDGHDNDTFNYSNIMQNYSIYAEEPKGLRAFVNNHVY